MNKVETTIPPQERPPEEEIRGVARAGRAMGRSEFAARVINVLSGKSVEALTPEERELLATANRQLAKPLEVTD